MILVLIILLLLLALGGLPTVCPIPHQWGYYPSGLITVLIVVLLVLLLTGRL